MDFDAARLEQMFHKLGGEVACLRRLTREVLIYRDDGRVLLVMGYGLSEWARRRVLKAAIFDVLAHRYQHGSLLEMVNVALAMLAETVATRGD